MTNFAGGIKSAGDIIPPEDEIPPAKSVENRAQNGVAGDTGDTGGIIRTSGEVESKNKFIKCPHCKFENIHPEIIEHHIRLTHNDGSEDNSKTHDKDGNMVGPSRGVADITNLPPPKTKEEVIE